MKVIMGKNKGGIFKFAAGLGLGVGLGMLFAPKKGEELRKDLKIKIEELLNDVKNIDVREVSEEFMNKIENFKKELEDLDREKVLDIAKKKSEELKKKALELVELAKEKGTPVLEKAADEVREKAILVTKDVLKKLEDKETKMVK